MLFRSDPVPHDSLGLILSADRESLRQKRGQVSFSVQIPIRFADVDAAGIVYYPRLLHICHQAFEELYQQRGPVPYHQWCQEKGLGFPTRRLEVDFDAPVLHAGPVTIDVSSSEIGTSSVCFHFRGRQMALADGKDVDCFRAKAWKVCCAIEGLQSTPIPQDVRDVLQSIEEPQ